METKLWRPQFSFAALLKAVAWACVLLAFVSYALNGDMGPPDFGHFVIGAILAGGCFTSICFRLTGRNSWIGFGFGMLFGCLAVALFVLIIIIGNL